MVVVLAKVLNIFHMTQITDVDIETHIKTCRLDKTQKIRDCNERKLQVVVVSNLKA